MSDQRLEPPKDRFSAQAAGYARFRPTYPKALFRFILEKTQGRSLAWDVATGNGQAAAELAEAFQKVVATDISSAQLSRAARWPNVEYRLERAEESSLDGASVDLTTVAQAVHWFDFERFFAQVKRVSKPGATVALFGYGLCRFEEPALMDAFLDFYRHGVGAFWDAERQHIDEAYRTVPFPFEELSAPSFSIEKSFSKVEFQGYLGTWSAVQKSKQTGSTDPVDPFVRSLDWDENERKRAVFPLIFRIGKVVG